MRIEQLPDCIRWIVVIGGKAVGLTCPYDAVGSVLDAAPRSEAPPSNVQVFGRVIDQFFRFDVTINRDLCAGVTNEGAAWWDAWYSHPADQQEAEAREAERSMLWGDYDEQ